MPNVRLTEVPLSQSWERGRGWRPPAVYTGFSVNNRRTIGMTPRHRWNGIALGGLAIALLLVACNPLGGVQKSIQEASTAVSAQYAWTAQCVPFPGR